MIGCLLLDVLLRLFEVARNFLVPLLQVGNFSFGFLEVFLVMGTMTLPRLIHNDSIIIVRNRKARNSQRISSDKRFEVGHASALFHSGL